MKVEGGVTIYQNCTLSRYIYLVIVDVVTHLKASIK